MPEALAGGITGVVWRDFKPGGGTPGQVEEDELGLPGITVELRDEGGGSVLETQTEADGTFAFEDVEAGSYRAAIGADTFSEPYAGVSWLGAEPDHTGDHDGVHLGLGRVLDGRDRRRARGDPARPPRGRAHRRRDRVAGLSARHDPAARAGAHRRLRDDADLRPQGVRHRDLDRARLGPGRRERDRPRDVANVLRRRQRLRPRRRDRGLPVPARDPDPRSSTSGASGGRSSVDCAAAPIEAPVAVPVEIVGADVVEDHPLPRADARLPRARVHRPALARPDARALLHVAARAVRRSARPAGGRSVDLAEHRDPRQLPRDPRQRGDHVRDLDDALDLARCDDPAHRRRGARGLRVRVARVPWARLAVHRRRRAPRRPDPDGADSDLLALQRPRAVRHDPRARPLPHRLRAAVRDLPAPELLHRDPARPARGGADRRRVGVPDLLPP